ncbi:MAG TPA: adenosylmethionine--8-amino-7-oxononanoate transaminase, partial [Alphaproteobacteria bacterium]|nr:adenosylmethionine--8-amino-7-oxononanoate transaminase [Alphaproteobacteria bacterium]
MQSLQDLDLNYTWHPCSQMKDYKSFKPLVIKGAKGAYIELKNGQKLIDAISSWWCKSLGHNHPALKKALIEQLEKFEHVIFANTTHEVIASLSQDLANLIKGLTKVFYTGDGSCAVEVALKMSLHSRKIKKHQRRTKFLSLKNGYHGETVGALSVSDLGLYKKPYEDLLFESYFIEPLYVSGRFDENWQNANSHWQKVLPLLEKHKNTLTAIIVEPLIQGAGGMKIYSKDFLSKLFSFAKDYNIHIIADEIMTGLARTGKMVACEYIEQKPDFVCLSKGLTSGFMPFSCVLTTQEIYDTFYGDFSSNKAFLHSHTHSGNALGASVAKVTLEVIKQENLCARALELERIMTNYMKDIQEQTGLLKNIRSLGAVVAADLVNSRNSPRLG